MKILAIETSCDETGIAIVEGGKTPNGFVFTTLGNVLLSQAALHAPYGGVYPTLAKREHEKNLPVVLDELFAKLSEKKYDAIAVTQGPGLEPALWQGIEFAKKLAQEKGLPLLPINHMEGHLVSSLARRNLGEGGANIFKLEHVRLPVLALLISGGHTEFVLMREWFVYELIGETLDDAVGECFDKVARMLDLPYPGGPEISKLAEMHRKQGETLLNKVSPCKLPRPMLHSDNCDFSFSGLKTAALYALRDFKATPSKAKESPLTQDEKAAFAVEFEDAAAEVFVAKTRRALQKTGARTFVIGGGVAANAHIRGSLQKLLAEEFSEVELRLPELSITGDNAIMIAQAALTHLLIGHWELSEMSRFDLDIKAVGNLALGQKIL